MHSLKVYKLGFVQSIMKKEDFFILDSVKTMDYCDPSELAIKFNISLKLAQKIFIDLEKQGLIELDQKGEEIYSSRLTDKSKKILSSSKYLVWKKEFENG